MSGLERWYLRQVAAWLLTFGWRTPAMNCYDRILEARPDDVDTLASAGFELARDGRKREALARFDRVVALDPGRAEPWFNRGFLAQELGDHGKALESFQRALEINPDHDRALYGAALSLIATKRLDEAVPLLERNTKLQPMSPYGWYQLGRLQHDRGRDRPHAGHHRPAREVRTEGRGAARARDRARRAAPAMTSRPALRRCSAVKRTGHVPTGRRRASARVAREAFPFILPPVRVSPSGSTRSTAARATGIEPAPQSPPRARAGRHLAGGIQKRISPFSARREPAMQLSAKHQEYWSKNLSITGILLFIWFVVTFVVGFFARELSFNFFGWPFAFWMGAQGSLIIYVIIIWFYARYMNNLDIEYGVDEKEEA